MSKELYEAQATNQQDAGGSQLKDAARERLSSDWTNKPELRHENNAPLMASFTPVRAAGESFLLNKDLILPNAMTGGTCGIMGGAFGFLASSDATLASASVFRRYLPTAAGAAIGVGAGLALGYGMYKLMGGGSGGGFGGSDYSNPLRHFDPANPLRHLDPTNPFRHLDPTNPFRTMDPTNPFNNSSFRR